MKSMTGFGRATIESGGRSITVELKSVNHRYLDINMRLHRTISFLDDELRGLLKKNFDRGHIDVYLYYDNKREATKVVEVDTALAKSYFEALCAINGTIGSDSVITAQDIAKIPEVINLKQEDDDEDEVKKIGCSVMMTAIDHLHQMRSIEGEKIKQDFVEKINTIEQLLQKVEEYAPNVVVEYREKLEQRISDLIKGTNVEVDENRISTEVAFFADKSSIDEEISRLHSHMTLIRDTIGKDEPTGRQLDFIVQEINREVNTICSKASDINITNTALEMKNTVEKIREQVQNVE